MIFIIVHSIQGLEQNERN